MNALDGSVDNVGTARIDFRTLFGLVRSLGFSSSNYESQTLEPSAVAHTEPVLKEGSFSRFVFDKADFNVCTLDGYNKFHTMGVIKCVTPPSSA
ncbi:hypothetical protein PR048_027394 [Dryococelus australis]|uniref:Uncharacterized protein n=1 Tax=Dryococelus australis TaxID=614101 RepID=A0ABQ9GFB6_9NEOP|nr:hypothetical protein PR048_027394 [Dryococelus australis]